MILVTNLAFSPQTGGCQEQYPKPTYQQQSVLQVFQLEAQVLTQPVTAWLDAINWMQNNVQSTDVVVIGGTMATG